MATTANHIIGNNRITYFRYSTGDKDSFYCWISESGVEVFTTSGIPTKYDTIYGSASQTAQIIGDVISVGDLLLNIYPYPLTNLSVVYASSSYSTIDLGDHYAVSIDTSMIPLGSNALISCDEYVDKSITLDSIGTYTVCVGNLYAWKIERGFAVTPVSARTFYTDTPTPSYDGTTVSTKPIIYNNNGISYSSINERDIGTWILSNASTGDTMTDTYITQATS